MSFHHRSGFARRMLFPLLLASVLALAAGCGKKQPVCLKVGILSGVASHGKAADGFKAGMAELGYEEGRTITYDLHALNDDRAEERRIADQFVKDGVDMIVAFPTEAALSVKAAVSGTDIPLVFTMSQVEGVDLIESIPRPGGNVTGVRLYVNDLMLKRLELFFELAPRAKRIWMVYDPRIPANPAALELMRPAAAAAGVTLVETHVTGFDEFAADVRKRDGQKDIGVDAVMMMPDAGTNGPEGWALMSRFAAQHGLPVSALLEWQVDAGALYTYTPDPLKAGKLAASLADKVAKGAPAGGIPVVTVDGSLIINYGTARNLGLTVAEGLQSMASRVIR